MTTKPSSNNIGKLIGCLAITVVILIVILGALAAAIYFIPGLTRSATPPAANVNVIVNLTVPLDDSTVPLNSSTAIQAEGLSTQPITTLELWVDGARFASKAVPQSGQKQFFASWGWTPAAAGDHTLFVRAGDATHPSVDSNPVHVMADASANPSIPVNYTAVPSDTVPSVAQKLDTTPQQIIDLNPQLGPASTITPGLTISVPLPMPEIPATLISTTLPSAPPLPPPPPASGGSAPSAPSPAIKLSNAKLVPTVPMIGVYCYLSVDGAPATRAPADSFIWANSSGAFDLTSSLPPLTVSPGQKTITLIFDCWGLSIGPPATVAHLGTATTTIDPSQPNAPLTLTGDMFKLDALLPNLSPAVRLALAGQLVPTPFIYPPSGLTDTGDPRVCASHSNPLFAAFGGEDICAGAINEHNLVLVWDWPSNPSPTYVNVNHPQRQYDVIKDIDGYRVYENDIFFQHKLVDATNIGSDGKVKIVSLPPKPGPFTVFLLEARALTAQRCFVVRAYKGSVESTDSNSWCLGDANPGTKTITIHYPDHATSVQHYHAVNSCLGAVPIEVQPPTGEVGYYHSSGECASEQTAVRSLLSFDLSAVDGPVWSATLDYHLQSGEIDHGLIGVWSCASQLMLPTENWTLPPADFVPADPYLNLKVSAGPTDFPTDVTSAVRNWQINGGNYGFEFRGQNEDTGAEDNLECDSVYSNFQLQVEYFPK